MTRFSFIEKRCSVELRNGALCTGTTSMLKVRWCSALCLEVSSLSGRVLGHALEADGRPGLALCVLLWRPATCSQFQVSEEFSQSWASFWSPACSSAASWVTSPQLKLNKIQSGFCGFLKELLFPLPGACHQCHHDPLYCSRASELWSVTAAATGSAGAAHTLNRTSRGDSKCGKGFFA